MEKQMRDEKADAKTVDPDAVLTVSLYAPQNSGKRVSTRWGHIAFDGQGNASIACKGSDLLLLDQLQWLLPEDRVKFGLLKPQAAKSAAVDPKVELKAKLDAVLQENAELTNKLLTMQAKLERANDELVAAQARAAAVESAVPVAASASVAKASSTKKNKS